MTETRYTEQQTDLIGRMFRRSHGCLEWKEVRVVDDCYLIAWYECSRDARLAEKTLHSFGIASASSSEFDSYVLDGNGETRRKTNYTVCIAW